MLTAFPIQPTQSIYFLPTFHTLITFTYFPNLPTLLTLSMILLYLIVFIILSLNCLQAEHSQPDLHSIPTLLSLICIPCLLFLLVKQFLTPGWMVSPTTGHQCWTYKSFQLSCLTYLWEFQSFIILINIFGDQTCRLLLRIWIIMTHNLLLDDLTGQNKTPKLTSLTIMKKVLLESLQFQLIILLKLKLQMKSL